MEDEEHEVYGGRIPDEADVDADVDMASRADEDAVKLQELDEMKKRLQVMEEAGATLREMQAKVVKEMGGVPGKMEGGDGDVNFELNKLPAVFIELEYSSDTRYILNLSTMKLHTITDPSFRTAACICIKDGWLLMGQGYLTTSWCSLFFLLNVISGAKIDLPIIQTYNSGPCTFSLASGIPDMVVTVSSSRLAGTITIKTIRPGDEAWKEYPTNVDGFMQSVSLVGMQVVCYANGGKIVVLDLSTGLYQASNKARSSKGTASVIEHDGVLVKIDLLQPVFSYFIVTKFDFGVMDWVDLDSCDLENTICFLNGCGGFMRKGKGRKAYTLEPNEYGEPGLPDYESAKHFRRKILSVTGNMKYNIYIHDLVACGGHGHYSGLVLQKNKTEHLLPTVFIAKHACLIDVDADLLSGPSSSISDITSEERIAELNRGEKAVLARFLRFNQTKAN